MYDIEKAISATVYSKETSDKMIELPIEAFIDIGFNQEFPKIKKEDNQKTGAIRVGDYFWEYNNGVGYKRKAHSKKHIEYFWKGYMTRVFFTVDELLFVYPNAIID